MKNYIHFKLSHSLYKKFKAFYFFSWQEKFLLFKVSMIILLLRFFLKFIALNKLYHFIGYFFKKPLYNCTEYPEYTEKAVWAVEIVGNYLLRTKCLAKAIALQILLNNKKISSVINVGFVKNKNIFSAHAWLIAGNAILIGHNKGVKFYFTFQLV